VRRRANLTRRVLAFELADIFFGILPRRLAYVLMTIVGWVVATCFKGRVAGLVANLRMVFPDYTETQVIDLMQRNAKNYGKFWADLFKMPHLKLDYRRSLAVIEGRENLDRVLARGKGCIVVTIHMGGWEGCAALWGGLEEYHSALIAEVLEPPGLWRRLLDLRQSSGLEIIPLGRTAARTILRRLQENWIVAGAIDRDILGTGKPYQFFGATAAIPSGLVDVAQRTGAGVLPVICLREPDDTYRFVGMEPIWVGPEEGAVDATMNRLLRIFEGCIRRYPDQWHVMEPIWASPGLSLASAPAIAGGTEGAGDLDGAPIELEEAKLG
jgi:phosphatidylinositol dimannoside acyltransferase